MADPPTPDEPREERTWLFDAVQRLHQAPDEALTPEQLANLLNADPDLQPRFDLGSDPMGSDPDSADPDENGA